MKKPVKSQNAANSSIVGGFGKYAIFQIFPAKMLGCGVPDAQIV